MNWRFSKSTNNKRVIISLYEKEVRFFLVHNKSTAIALQSSHSENYKNIGSLESICLNWLKQNSIKDIDCHWLLSRSLYKTISLTPPNVSNSEVDSSIKWLVKDQVEQPINNLLVSHYIPYYKDDTSKKLTAVITDKSLIKAIVEITSKAQLNLKGIEINELTSVNAIKSFLDKNKVVGFIHQDNKGLVYNFYIGDKLAFTRHIKGRFFPTKIDNDFSLELDNQQDNLDSFLLETQRTLDYCVSQVFRKSVDELVIEHSKSNVENSLKQITELPINIIKESELISVLKQPVPLSISELGIIIGGVKNIKPLVNFYCQEFKPKPLEFDFKFSMVVTVLMFFGFTAYGLILNNESNLLKQQLTQKNKSFKDIQNSIKTLNFESFSPSLVKSIDSQIITKQNELINIKKLLEKIASKSNEKHIHYSLVLNKLSKQRIQSLWLTNITLTPTNISLKGSTTNPELIPDYIDKIGQHNSLNSQFENLLLERDKENNQIINFNISNGNYHRAD